MAGISHNYLRLSRKIVVKTQKYKQKGENLKEKPIYSLVYKNKREAKGTFMLRGHQSAVVSYQNTWCSSAAALCAQSWWGRLEQVKLLLGYNTIQV